MRLEEAQSGGEQRRVAGPAPKLVCPNSGQVEEPPRAPFVAERRRKRGEGESHGVVWRLERHGLDSRMNGEGKRIWPRS